MSEPPLYPPAPAPPPLSEWPAAPPSPFAGWWRRCFALILDTLLTMVFVLPLMLALLLAFDPRDEDTFLDIVWIPLFIAFLFLYYPLTMRRAGTHNGQTWGKQALGIRVVREDGEPFDARSAIIREILWKQLVFWTLGGILCSIPAIVDALFPLRDERNQSVHDKAASTLVVRA